jgi:hypothetical protein
VRAGLHAGACMRCVLQLYVLVIMIGLSGLLACLVRLGPPVRLALLRRPYITRLSLLRLLHFALQTPRQHSQLHACTVTHHLLRPLTHSPLPFPP